MKNIKVSKGMAFLFCLAAIMFIYTTMALMGFFKNSLDVIPVSACLTGIGALAGLFIGGNVADNIGKGKNWKQEMFDSENGGKK